MHILWSVLPSKLTYLVVGPEREEHSRNSLSVTTSPQPWGKTWYFFTFTKRPSHSKALVKYVFRKVLQVTHRGFISCSAQLRAESPHQAFFSGFPPHLIAAGSPFSHHHPPPTRILPSEPPASFPSPCSSVSPVFVYTFHPFQLTSSQSSTHSAKNFLHLPESTLLKGKGWTTRSVVFSVPWLNHNGKEHFKKEYMCDWITLLYSRN